MKICLINHSFPPQIGGGETHVYLLARGFCERGHDVTVITGGDENKMLMSDNNKFYSLVKIKYLGDIEKGNIFYKNILNDIYKILIDGSFDVMHIHNFLPGLTCAPLSSLVKNTVFTFHSTPILDENKIIGLFSCFDLERIFATFILNLPFCNIVCPSKYYYDWALKLGACREKLSLIYHGVELKDYMGKRDNNWKKSYGYTEDDFVVVSPARMIRRKGILDLLEAVLLINNKKIKFLILTSITSGSQEYANCVFEYIRKNNLSDRVRVVADKENFFTMQNILVNCDLLVLPSHIEGLGIALLEGMAAGIPVIGSNTFGINEIIQNGVNGLFIRLNDPVDLADKINKVYFDKSLRRTLIVGGLHSVGSKFSLKKQLNQLELIYKNNI